MDAQVDDAIQSASDMIDGETHRFFYPELDTRSFDWPNYSYARSWRLWLDGNELISVTALVAGGTTIAASDYLLRRSDDRDEPPYDHIEIDLSSGAAFSAGDTHQQSIAITGLYGHTNAEAPAGATAEVLDASETDVDVTNSAAVGVGDLIRVDTERLLVTEKAMLDTGQNLATGLTAASVSDVSGTVADNSVLNVGETLLIDSERVLLVDKSGSTGITVKRAWDGTVLATHTTPDVYAPRRLTVVRGALGTTAAAHLTAAPIFRHVAPGLIRAWGRAEAINTLEQELSAYGRVVGSGDNEREASGKGLADIRREAMTAFGRQARLGAI